MNPKILFAPLLAATLMAALPSDRALEQAVAETWTQLPQTENSCGNFDYFPEGGMQNFYCHVAEYLPYDQLQRWLGQTAFLKGPHSKNKLHLSADNYFGYYNPAFVQAIGERLIPGSQDSAFRLATQSVYDQTVAPLARIHWVTYQKLLKNPEFYHEEVEHYRNLVDQSRLPAMYYEKYFYFMNPAYPQQQDEDVLMGEGFDGGWNGNVVKSATAFWLRRTIDGTADEFATALEKLLRTYDAGFLANPQAPQAKG
jgi:hypothetical protein